MREKSCLFFSAFMHNFSFLSVYQDNESLISSLLGILNLLIFGKDALMKTYFSLKGILNVTDPDLIDCYIYEVNSALKRYRFLLQQAERMQLYEACESSPPELYENNPLTCEQPLVQRLFFVSTLRYNILFYFHNSQNFR